jgi:hypothetical protein
MAKHNIKCTKTRRLSLLAAGSDASAPPSHLFAAICQQSIDRENHDPLALTAKISLDRSRAAN